jgi:SAM-dependent methyltransferase
MRSLILEAIIRLSQHTKRGSCKVSFNALQGSFTSERTESDHEAKGLDEFLVRFQPSILPGLAGMRVLDFGCGYGGKSVELASRVPSAFVTGIDIHQKKVDRGCDFARRRGVANVGFKLCTQNEIPLDDDSVDAVVCHDVLEHVHRPDVTFRELARVMKPGARLYSVFPPYDGPVSHHLDFITGVPFLHWIWAPDTIMETVNRILSSEYGKRFNTPPQPPPSDSPLNGRRVLPSLNGLGTKTLIELVAGSFSVVSVERVMLIDRLTKLRVPPAAIVRARTMALKRLPLDTLDHLTISMAVILERVSPRPT